MGVAGGMCDLDGAGGVVEFKVAGGVAVSEGVREREREREARMRTWQKR